MGLADAAAVEGQREELFLVAEKVDDPSSVALSRFRASVIPVDVVDVPDEADQLSTFDAEGDAPPVGATLPAALLAVLVFLIRDGRHDLVPNLRGVLPKILLLRCTPSFTIDLRNR